MEVAKTSEIGEISQKVSQKAEISPKLGEIASEAEKKEKKDRGGYFKQRYQEKKQYWRERYQNIKVSGLVGKNEEQKKYSDAEAYKVLMSLKEYTELNPVKRKNWLDFVKTFRELGDNTGIEVKGIIISDIIQVMKLREDAENLINDYGKTAKNEIRRGRNWKSLDDEKKSRLLNYGGQKRAKEEEKLASQLESQAEKGKRGEKEIREMVEVSKLHEERGKKGCKCGNCEEIKRQKEIEEGELKQEEKKAKKAEKVKGECVNCFEEKKVDEDSGLCKNCEEEQEAEQDREEL